MRAFIAVEFSEEIKVYLSTIQSFIQQKSAKGNFTPQDNFHLTLRFIGEVQPNQIEQLQQAMYTAVENKEPFMLTLQGLGSFPRQNKSIVWIGLQKSENLIRLHNDQEEGLYQIGYAKEERGLTPHITLGREVLLHREFRSIQKEIQILPKEIWVDHITLMESTRKNGVLTYVPIYRQLLQRGSFYVR